MLSQYSNVEITMNPRPHNFTTFLSFLSFKVSQALKRGAVVPLESAIRRQNKDVGVAGLEFKSRLCYL